MLGSVLLVLLAGVPVCVGAAAAYSDYYDSDGVNEEADFYNNYNEEIRAPTGMATVIDAVTRMKKRELEDIRSLDPVESFDVKGALHNILHQTTPESSKKLQATVRHKSNTYDHIEHSNAMQKANPANRDGSNGNILYKKWSPSLQVQHWSPTAHTQESVADYSSQTDQRWIHVHQTGASTYIRKNDIIAQIRKIVPVFDGEMATWSPLIGVQRFPPAVDIQTSSIEEQTVHPADDIQTLSNDVQSLYPTVVVQTLTTIDDSDTQYNMVYQHNSTYSNSDVQAEVSKAVPHWNLSSNVHRRSLPNNVQHWSVINDIPLWNLSDNILQRKPAGQAQHWGPAIDVEHYRPSSNVIHHTPPSSVQHWSSSDNIQHQSPTVDNEQWDLYSSWTQYARQQELRNKGNKRTTTPPVTTPPTPTPVTNKSQVLMDLDNIINILRNLTDDYEWNITDYFNKSLIEHGFSTCGKYYTTEEWTSTDTTGLDFEGAAVVSKCFVCGLKTPEIPRNAHCADAFAGDFLPLMPVNPQSRAQIASYRKYCRHVDAHNYIENAIDPRAIYGRFTGGCAVRWTDLTGVYTQRTCRSKYRPLMGQHFASKRMAKLELALVNVDDGCIISPMATLLPVSRGISLYARFHACVCSTNWCNKATHRDSSLYSTIIFVLACWCAHYT